MSTRGGDGINFIIELDQCQVMNEFVFGVGWGADVG